MLAALGPDHHLLAQAGALLDHRHLGRLDHRTRRDDPI
jgi:hypothetical protein